MREIRQELVILRGSGSDAEAARISRRWHVRVVSVEAIQEGEEGAVLPPPVAQPAKEGVVDPARVAGLEADPLPIVKVAANDVLEDPAPRDRAAQQVPWRQRVIFVMNETSIQPGLVTAVVGVRGE